MVSQSPSHKAARFFPIVLVLVALAPLDASSATSSSTLYARCNAAYRARDYAVATSVCVQSAIANFTEADALISKYVYVITNKYNYYQDMLLGADSQEAAGESYIYGHIDALEGEELSTTAMSTLQDILDGATDPQTLQNANQSLAEATKFAGEYHVGSF
jgi:hypothetical protein